jgi:hypothetical protein
MHLGSFYRHYFTLLVADVHNSFLLHSVVLTQHRYDRTAQNLVPKYAEFAAQGVRTLIFSGDADACVPYLGTTQWVTELASSQGWGATDAVWSPWLAGKQIAGYLTKFKTNGGADFFFATVRGAGHMVPTDKPKEALAMLHYFLNDPATSASGAGEKTKSKGVDCSTWTCSFDDARCSRSAPWILSSACVDCSTWTCSFDDAQCSRSAPWILSSACVNCSTWTCSFDDAQCSFVLERLAFALDECCCDVRSHACCRLETYIACISGVPFSRRCHDELCQTLLFLCRSHCEHAASALADHELFHPTKIKPCHASLKEHGEYAATVITNRTDQPCSSQYSLPGGACWNANVGDLLTLQVLSEPKRINVRCFGSALSIVSPFWFWSTPSYHTHC